MGRGVADGAEIVLVAVFALVAVFVGVGVGVAVRVLLGFGLAVLVGVLAKVGVSDSCVAAAVFGGVVGVSVAVGTGGCAIGFINDLPWRSLLTAATI